MEILIRKAEIKDSEAIANLSSELGYEVKKIESQERLYKIIKNPDHQVYIAIIDNAIAGWIHAVYSVRLQSSAYVEITGLVVNQNYRRNGVGNKLVQSVFNWASSINCPKVRVRCKLIRLESHKFYEKMGFELSKEQKVFDKIVGKS